jgi:hypothetical protein
MSVIEQWNLPVKHAEIDRMIQEEEHRPHPDDGALAELKRQKLRIKDEIAVLNREPGNA